jgi:hypothetical protein
MSVDTAVMSVDKLRASTVLTDFRPVHTRRVHPPADQLQHVPNPFSSIGRVPTGIFRRTFSSDVGDGAFCAVEVPTNLTNLTNLTKLTDPVHLPWGGARYLPWA